MSTPQAIPYLSRDGVLDLSKAFDFTPKQWEMPCSFAPQFLQVGGVRSGKTVGALMYGVQAYCLTYSHCDMLVLRRTFKELESGAILDFRTLIPNPGGKVYDWNDQKKIATFHNGSRLVFGHCTHNKERDIEQYLGQAYPFILVDECAQFSPDAWLLLNSRNTINAACKPNEAGEMPLPRQVGCTNPFGPFWPYYHQTFVLKEPWEKQEDSFKTADGRHWVQEAGERRCIYNPADYEYSHSTVLDNPHILKRDPEIITRLNRLPKAKREKMLLGYMDRVEGQYYDCFDPTYHVVNLRDDPGAIKWQDWQPVWAGGDWGVGHYSAFYFFTRALVRNSVGDDYKQKTVCFAEVVPGQTGMSNVQVADLIHARVKHPSLGGTPKMAAFYFSHEKFNRVMEAHSPADEFSRLLRDRGFCSVSPATRDRIGRASLLYNQLSEGKLVILDQCSEIIRSLPNLMRDPDNLDDVFKPDGVAKADDCYDGFSYGLFGMLGSRHKPQGVIDAEVLSAIEDPFVKRMTLFKQNMDAKKRAELPTSLPSWRRRLIN